MKKDQATAVGKATNKQKAYYKRESLRYEPYAFTVYNGPTRVISSHKHVMEMPKPAKMKGAAEEIHVLAGGSLEAPTERVDASVISVVNGFAQPKSKLPELKIPQTMSRCRTALVEWVVNRDNPLTACVMVNRVWQHLFSGQALVGTPNDFGHELLEPQLEHIADRLELGFERIPAL